MQRLPIAAAIASVVLSSLLALQAAELSASETGFVIRVIDIDNGRPVPLVELTTTHAQTYISDNAGVVFVDSPELMDRQVFFKVSSHGYDYPKDGFGMRGVRLPVRAGESATIEVQRRNIAERLYRITGAGRHYHSRKAGLPIADGVRDPRPDGGVFGCDSVHVAEFGERLFWIWGDTNRARYPLGNFQATGATSPLPRSASKPNGFDPEVDVPLSYFMKPAADGEAPFVKGIAPMTGEGPTWLGGLTNLRDAEGREHLVSSYVKVKAPLTVYRRGLCEFDSESQAFVHVADQAMPEADQEESVYPDGHSFEVRDAEGLDWIYYADPLPTLRHPASYEAWRDPTTYEKIISDAALSDPISGKKVTPHRGSIAWNDYRQRWVMIFCETGGEASQLGELWYAEATSPEGPWRACVKVVSHDRYSFYNPCQHPSFSTGDGRIIYFEGTYTAMFSRTAAKTPRYNYNQILYRLDLDDPRLTPAETASDQ